jgi:hypothetical protein
VSRSVKKQLSFFLIVLCGVISYNYVATRQIEHTVVNSSVQERERAFIQERAEYIKNHGETSMADQEINKNWHSEEHSLINSSSSYQSAKEQDLEKFVK